MSARQMYSTSIKSPFPPCPLPWLQSLPAFVVPPPPPVQMPGWDGRQLTSRWPSPRAAFLLGVPQPALPGDTHLLVHLCPKRPASRDQTHQTV